MLFFLRNRVNHRLIGIILALVLAVTGVASSYARPYRGSVSWSVLLCTFTGSPAPTRTPAFYRDMFVNAGTGGLRDYWQSVSYGGLNLDGTVVKGWYTEPFTFTQSQARDRGQIFQDCIDAARNSPTDPYTVPAGQLVAVITSPDRDLYGWPGRGAFLPELVDLGAMAHEVGHGLGFNHSFSDDPTYRNASWAQIGEYDDQWECHELCERLQHSNEQLRLRRAWLECLPR